MQSIFIDYNLEHKRFIVHLRGYDEGAFKHLMNAPEQKYKHEQKLFILPSTSKNAIHLLNLLSDPSDFYTPDSRVEISDEAKNCLARVKNALEEQTKHLQAVENIAYDETQYVGHTPKTEPKKHQIAVFNLAKDRNNFAIFFEQGLGKTKSAIDLVEYWMIKSIIDHAIVLCPNFVKSVWRKEILKHSGLTIPVFIINGSEGFKRFRTLGLAHKEEKCWIILNYEELITSVYGELAYEVENFKCAIIGDESTRLKNRAAKSVKAAVDLSSKCKKTLILTGTPVTNNPLDFWAQFKFLGADLGFSTFTAFQNRYAVVQAIKLKSGGRYNQVLNWINLEELKQKVQAFSLRKTKEECLDLPDKVYQILDIELPEENRKLYDKMKKESAIELKSEAEGSGGRVSASNIISKLLRLSQIVGGTLKLETGELTRLKQQPKLDALANLIEEIDGSHQIIIWARFVEEIKMIHDFLDELGISNTTNFGETKNADREQNIDDFQNGKVRVFIAQPHALGYGVTLTAASYVIYYSNDFSLEARMQSEDRAHRIGLDHAVVYVDLLAHNTVDKLVKRALEAKQDLASFIVDNKLNPFSANYVEEE